MVEKVTRVKDCAHSRHLAGKVAANRIQLFMSPRNFPPTAVAGCTGPQSTYVEEARVEQSTLHASAEICAAIYKLTVTPYIQGYRLIYMTFDLVIDCEHSYCDSVLASSLIMRYGQIVMGPAGSGKVGCRGW